MELYGYLRPNGDVGFRNNVLVLSTVACASETARRIAFGMEGVVTALHVHGCGHLGEDLQQAKRILQRTGMNPNISAVLVVGLGCENISAVELAREISAVGKPVQYINIQHVGGTEKAVIEGKKIIKDLIDYSNHHERQAVDFNKVVIGLNCGGSDTFSGLITNPSVGVASDLIVQAGGTVILSEIPELIGAEHIVAKRAVNPKVRDDIYNVVNNFERRLLDTKVDIRGAQPSTGNIKAGLSTIEEKSLGAITKSGSTAINQVIKYGERPIQSGVVIMDGPGIDVVCNTGLAASGAQIILFTTGLGNPVGSPIAPVVKITGTKETYERMYDNIDISVHSVMDSEDTIYEAGERIFNFIIDVLNGKQKTKAEKLGYHEFDFWRIMPTT